MLGMWQPSTGKRFALAQLIVQVTSSEAFPGQNDRLWTQEDMIPMRTTRAMTSFQRHVALLCSSCLCGQAGPAARVPQVDASRERRAVATDFMLKAEAAIAREASASRGFMLKASC